MVSAPTQSDFRKIRKNLNTMHFNPHQNQVLNAFDHPNGICHSRVLSDKYIANASSVCLSLCIQSLSFKEWKLNSATVLLNCNLQLVALT